MVTHNEAIAQTCDRVIHIEDGQLLQEEDFRQKAVMSYVKAGMEIYAVLQEPDICNFCVFLLTTSLLSGISSFDLQQSEKVIWRTAKLFTETGIVILETDKELLIL